MKISNLIKELQNVKKADGDCTLRGYKFETVSFTQEYHMNSRKDDDKKMTKAEFKKLYGKK